MTGSTSYETDRLRKHPTCKPKLCTYQPNDSKHGGKLFCTGEITGEPPLVEFDKDVDKDGLEKPAGWVSQVESVRQSIELYFKKDSVFTKKRQESWKRFFRGVPFGGLESLRSANREPVFGVNLQLLEGKGWHQEGDDTELLKNVGFDSGGRLRVFYKGGKGVAVYEPARVWANFGGKLVGGSSCAVRRVQQG